VVEEWGTPHTSKYMNRKIDAIGRRGRRKAEGKRKKAIDNRQ
jgi:hypothetical protein